MSLAHLEFVRLFGNFGKIECTVYLWPFQFGRAVGSQLGSSGYGDVPRQYGAPPPHSLRQTMMLSSTSSQNRQWVRDIIF